MAAPRRPHVRAGALALTTTTWAATCRSTCISTCATTMSMRWCCGGTPRRAGTWASAAPTRIPRVAALQRHAMRRYRALDRYYKRGEFFGFGQEVHVHVLPEEHGHGGEPVQSLGPGTRRSAPRFRSTGWGSIATAGMPPAQATAATASTPTPAPMPWPDRCLPGRRLSLRSARSLSEAASLVDPTPGGGRARRTSGIQADEQAS